MVLFQAKGFGASIGAKILTVGGLLALHCCLLRSVEGFRVGKDSYRRGADLDTQERYHLVWRVDEQTGLITFNVTVHTRGWILFGLAKNAEEHTGRDVVVGGVRKNGKVYFMDGYTDGRNSIIRQDRSQDYLLNSFWESGAYTFLSFTRDLETCDIQDYSITENKVTIIWAYGTDDTVDGMEGEDVRQGSYDVYLLDPEHAPRVTHENLFDNRPRLTGMESRVTQIWRVPKETKLPHDHTSVLCSIHKAPSLQRKHHVIGFDVDFADPASRNHVRHLIIYRCRAPRGVSYHSLFESYAKNGQEQSCLSTQRPVVGRNMPTYYCTEMYLVWAAGGRPYFVPDHVGFPFGENSEEYYMTQIHYENPQRRSGMTVSLSLDLFYTNILRPNDAGLLRFGHEAPGLPMSTLVPPHTSNARMYSHCSTECTKRMLPKEGITLVGGLLYGHTSGRQIRLRHFRGKVELPWILYDDNYNSEFQQVRALPGDEVKLLPSDQVTIDCMHDNTWTNGTVLGGFRSRHEMCLAFMVYYTLIPEYGYCHSEINSPEYRQRFLGVTNITWFESDQDWVVTSPIPRSMAGRTITDISDNFVDWNEDARQELREFQQQHTQMGRCNRHLHMRDPRDIQRILDRFEERTNSARELVIRDDETNRMDTEDEFAGPTGYPRGVTRFNPPDSIC